MTAVKNYTYIDVVDTAILCGLDIKQTTIGRDEVAARCPYCDDYKYRFYLSRKPDNSAFWCHNCGATGNAVTLYADFNPQGRRLTNYEAYKELLENPYVHKGELPADRVKSVGSIKPLEERSQIYLNLLNLLDLDEKHYINLHNRGLSDEMIKGNMYRSLPMDYKKRQRVVGQLSSWFDLSGMPGFYTSNGKWQMSNCKYSGILLPVCDKDNNIQGLQIRYDNLPPKIIVDANGKRQEKKGDRFRWLSTNGSYENGTGIPSYIHIVGDITSDTLHLTEGPLKADVASYLSGGELFIGLTGVQNVGFLREVITELRPKRILECIDMDVRTNDHVRKAQTKIRAICMPLCEQYRAITWPVDQKGIDDYLLFEKLKRENGLAA